MLGQKYDICLEYLMMKLMRLGFVDQKSQIYGSGLEDKNEDTGKNLAST